MQDSLESEDNQVCQVNKGNQVKEVSRVMYLQLTVLLAHLVKQEMMEVLASLDCLVSLDKKVTQVIKAQLESQVEMDKMAEEDPKEILDNLVLKAFLVDKEEMEQVDPLDLLELWSKEKKFPDHQEHQAEMACQDPQAHLVQREKGESVVIKEGMASLEILEKEGLLA